jgi:hypothetical protein
MDKYYPRQRLEERPPAAGLRLKAKDALPCASAKRSSSEALLNKKLTLFPLVIPTIPTFHVVFSKLRNLGPSRMTSSRTVPCMKSGC